MISSGRSRKNLNDSIAKVGEGGEGFFQGGVGGRSQRNNVDEGFGGGAGASGWGGVAGGGRGYCGGGSGKAKASVG